ncbi:CSC1-like protein 1 [Oppia nitens]|uniref:CSC1-like protein 1 n=1 Tax=Oppia nitens TaxID=1686743 RepID=UPI0023DB2DE8|nr:CSC1-like protein 1 [Oppia nitens]
MLHMSDLPEWMDNILMDNPSNSNFTCNIIVPKNKTYVAIQRGWEGIPESVVLNLILCLIMIMIFVITRQLARRKQRHTLATNDDSWLQFIYGDRKNNFTDCGIKDNTRTPIPYHLHPLNDTNLIFPPILSPKTSPINRSNTSTTIESVNEPFDSNGVIEVEINDSLHRNEDMNTTTNIEDIVDNVRPSNDQTHDQNSLLETIATSCSSESLRKYGHRFLHFISIKDDHILRTKGRDAYQYLIFQKYIIYFLALLTFVCLVIVLPVNIQGNFEGRPKAFGRTTISNLDPKSDLFWIHAVLAAIIIPLGVFVMNHFSKVIKSDDENITRRTLLIRRIPKFKNTKEILINYFQQSFPDCHITGIQVVHDFTDLQSLELEYQNAVNAKEFCDNYQTKHNQKLSIRPYCMGQLGCCCCCFCQSVDGYEYYSQSVVKITEELKKELSNMFSMPTGSVFITFETEKQAMEIYKYLKERQQSCLCCVCITNVITWITSVFNDNQIDSLELNRWQVSYAPYPDDINWKDLTVDYKWIWLRKVLIYLFLFVVFFFLSTPAILLKGMEFIANQKSIDKGIFKFSSTWSDFLSPLLLMSMTTVLPIIVITACERLPFKTISALNHAIMWKVYIFLVMMVIILPSAGLLSTNALLENIFSTNETKRFRWQCLFPVDNGAFFVNYALQAALLQNTVDVLRLPELFLYLFYYLLIRSPAEYKNARKQVLFDFPFGVTYPRFLLIFAMTVTYSLACPLIAPCGLFYMICRHIVDRYNIYYIYTPTKITGRIHSTAVLYVHIALLMMQFQVFTFLLMRTGNTKVTAFSMFVLLIALLVFSGHCFFHWFRNINHLTYSVTTKLNRRPKKLDYCACGYAPPVYGHLINDGVVNKDDLMTNNDHNS